VDRITGPDVDADLFGAGKDGFKDPDIGIDAATTVNADWLNGVQEEILGVIEGNNATPDSADSGQLYKSLLSMFASSAVVNRQARTLDASFAGTVHGIGRKTGRLVAVGGTPAEVQTSPDGVTWTHQTHSGFAGGGAFFSDVAWNGTVLVIVGSSAEIQTSPDGVTWTHRSAAGAYAGVFYGVAWNGTKFCAVGSAGEIQTSPDGITWTHAASVGGLGSIFHDIVWADALSLWVAVGDSDVIQTSPDGATWTQLTGTFGSPNTWSGVAWSGSVLCIVGSDGAVPLIKTSVDGVTLTTRTPATSLGTGLTGITWGSELFVAVGSGGDVQCSAGGIVWSTLAITNTSTNYASIFFGHRSFLIGGASGSLMQSLLLA
jgi:hypothetical protein